MFGCLIFTWCNCLVRIRGYNFVEGGLSLGMDFEVSKTQVILVSSLSGLGLWTRCVSSLLSPVLWLPAYFYGLHYDGHGLSNDGHSQRRHHWPNYFSYFSSFFYFILHMYRLIFPTTFCLQRNCKVRYRITSILGYIFIINIFLGYVYYHCNYIPWALIFRFFLLFHLNSF